MDIRLFTQRCFQLLIVSVGKILYLPIMRRTGQDEVDVHKLKSGIIFVANHQQLDDAFIISAALPYRICLRVAPVGFMLTNLFYDSWMGSLFRLAGCYPARNPNNQHRFYGVDGSIELLKRNQSIFIFPEGKRVQNGENAKVHSGVIRIHQGAPAAPIILCHIVHQPGWRAIIKRSRYKIVFSYINKANFKDPEEVMKTIYQL